MAKTFAGFASSANLPPFTPDSRLPDGVHLHNVRPAGKQLLCHVGHFRFRNQRALKKRRAASGNEEKHRIVFSEPGFTSSIAARVAR